MKNPNLRGVVKSPRSCWSRNKVKRFQYIQRYIYNPKKTPKS